VSFWRHAAAGTRQAVVAVDGFKAPLQRKAPSVGVRHTAFERIADRSLQLRGAVTIERAARSLTALRHGGRLVILILAASRSSSLSSWFFEERRICVAAARTGARHAPFRHFFVVLSKRTQVVFLKLFEVEQSVMRTFHRADQLVEFDLRRRRVAVLCSG
jgi:hypothetical protein